MNTTRIFYRWTLVAILVALTACSDDGLTGSSVLDAGRERDAATAATPDTDVAAPTPEDVGVDVSAPMPDAQLADATIPEADATIPDGYFDPTGASGTRLRRRYLEADEGAYMTVGLWDTGLGASCRFRAAPDGSLRCFPDVASQLYYADAGCTELIHVTRATECDTPWGIRPTDGAVFKTTPGSVAPPNMLYLPDSTGCRSYYADRNDTYRTVELVPSNQFVAGTVEEQPRTDDLVARYIAGSDGSRILTEVVHGTYGYTCVFDDDRRCLPEDYHDTYYLDAGCSQPVQYAPGTEPPPVLQALVWNYQGCLAGSEFYETGSPVSPTTLYRVSGTGACTSTSVRGTGIYYRRGTPLPLGSFPVASVALEGDGPLQGRRYVDGNGEALGTVNAFWDAPRDEACDDFAVSGDRGFVCVPEDRASLFSGRFADANCSQPIATTRCATSAPRLLAAFAGRACNLGSRLALEGIWERGAEIGQDIYRAHAGTDACRADTLGEGVTGYRLGFDAMSQLPTLELRME